MKVKDAMHKGVDWVTPDTPVSELAKLMCEHDIGAIPIGENDRLIGMVTDRDIVCKGVALDSFDADRPDVIERARAAGVTRLLVTGSSVASTRAAIALSRQWP